MGDARTFGDHGTEQNWLIGFSKSGLGAQDLLLKHPDLFAAAASWDFPADMDAYDVGSRHPARYRRQLRNGRQLPGQLPPDAELRRTPTRRRSRPRTGSGSAGTRTSRPTSPTTTRC